MHITFDTDNSTALQLTALAAFIGELAVLARSSQSPSRTDDKRTVVAAAPAVIAPADNPSTGLNTAELFSKVPPLASQPDLQVPSSPVDTAAMFGVQLHPSNIPPLPAAAPAIVIDAEGLPWDERIHASTKERTAKGLWKARRGVNDAAMIQRVKSELLATMALPAGAPAQQTVPAPVFQHPAAVVVVPAPVALPPAVQQLSQSLLHDIQQGGPIATPPVAVVKEPTNLGELMAQAGPLLASGQLAPDSLTTACQAIGLPSLTALATRPDLTTQVWRKLFGG